MTSIYDYQSPRQFLLDRVSALQKDDATLSIRALAKRMGMKSHALLLMLLQGKRPLRVKHAPFLARGLGLSSQERLFLQALIQFDSAEDVEEKKVCGLWLAGLHPERPVRTREIDAYEILSHWIHMAILALIETEGFDSRPESIVRRLGGRVSEHEVRAAIERLLAHGLIAPQTAEKYEEGGALRLTSERVTTADDVANRGACNYHRSVMKLADEALERVPLSQREFQAFAISIPTEKTALAKDLIRKFRTQFAQAMGAEPGDEVYQLNIQLFQLTESPSRMVRDEDEGVDSGYAGSSLPDPKGVKPC